MKVSVRFALCLLLVFLTSGSFCLGQETVDLNGYYWKKLTPDNKLGFAIGFINGYSMGFGDGKFKVLITLKTVNKDTPHFNEAANAKPSADPSAMTFGQLRDGIDECFKDFRNQDLDVSDCAQWAVEGAAGESDKDREAWMEFRRTQVSKHN